ncbi:hypothetical protein CCS41_03040 [Candidatus Fukatsuia symbiotica]|uniref:SecA family profile domain-containing protein n=1 Tax=Candidatus Fukatsuia symbiotica TaxID=1878942 RepID=A0A2U8I3J8_9GAMM|nr:hypothetical protein CCS41_03040 [Candidatus Fukatsuia symbiotica]
MPQLIFNDDSYVKTHQHSAGAASSGTEAIGKSRAGNTTKIHLGVDAYGLPIAFEITGVKLMIVQRHPLFGINSPFRGCGGR